MGHRGADVQQLYVVGDGGSDEQAGRWHHEQAGALGARAKAVPGGTDIPIDFDVRWVVLLGAPPIRHNLFTTKSFFSESRPLDFITSCAFVV